ncbi:MAG: WD40 repeat domain-containing protein, partial [Verrucomicrobiota bacterium]
ILFRDGLGEPIGEDLPIVGTNQIAAVNREKNRLVVVNIQGDLVLIDLETRQRLELDDELFEAGQFIATVLFAPDSDRFVIGSSQGRLELWNAETREREWVSVLPTPLVSVVFSYEGGRLVVCGTNGERYDVDTRTGDLLDDIGQQGERIVQLVESGSDFRYYTVSESGMVSAVDPGHGPRSFSAERVQTPVLFSAFEPTRRLTAYVSEKEVCLWRVLNLVRISRLPLPDMPTSIFVHPEKDLAFVGTEESGVLLWDFERRRLFGMELHEVKNAIRIQADASARTLRAISRDGVLRHYRLPGQVAEPVSNQKLPPGWTEVLLENRNVALIEAGDLNLLHLRDLPEEAPRSIGITQRGDRVFGAFRDGIIRVWDVKSGELVDYFETESTSVRTVDASPDGTLLVFRDRFSHAAMYDLVRKELRRFAFKRSYDISSVAFAPDGQTFAVATDGGVIQLYDVQSGEPVSIEFSHDVRGSVAPHYIRFSKDGRILLTWGGPDRSFRRWDLETGSELGVPIVGQGEPKLARFLRGDEFLASVTKLGREEGILRLWSVESGRPVTPAQRIDLKKFDFSSVRIPSREPFSKEEIQRIRNRSLVLP